MQSVFLGNQLRRTYLLFLEDEVQPISFHDSETVSIHQRIDEMIEKRKTRFRDGTSMLKGKNRNTQPVIELPGFWDAPRHSNCARAALPGPIPGLHRDKIASLVKRNDMTKDDAVPLAAKNGRFVDKQGLYLVFIRHLAFQVDLIEEYRLLVSPASQRNEGRFITASAEKNLHQVQVAGDV